MQKHRRLQRATGVHGRTRAALSLEVCPQAPIRAIHLPAALVVMPALAVLLHTASAQHATSATLAGSVRELHRWLGLLRGNVLLHLVRDVSRSGG